MQNDRLFTDKTIQKHIEKFGKEQYVKDVQEKLATLEKAYLHKKKKLTHILERIEKDFS